MTFVPAALQVPTDAADAVAAAVEQQVRDCDKLLVLIYQVFLNVYQNIRDCDIHEEAATN